MSTFGDAKYRYPEGRPGANQARPALPRIAPRTEEVRAPAEVYGALMAAATALRSTAKPELAVAPKATEVGEYLAHFESCVGTKNYLETLSSEAWSGLPDTVKDLQEMAKYAIVDLHEVAHNVVPVLNRHRELTNTVKEWNAHLMVLLDELEKSVLVVTQPEDAAKLGIVLKPARRSVIFNQLHTISN